MQINIINVTAVIDYIERNLGNKLDLEHIACAVHYSKYHLHRVFTDTIGLTMHLRQFYPLQLRYVLNNQPTKITTEIDWQTDIVCAKESDIPAWMDLLSLVVDGFPYLNETEYVEKLKQCICKKQALIIKDDTIIIAAMAFHNETGSIDFLGIHPQYRKEDIVKAFLQKAFDELLKDVPISVTTFRAGDKADLGYRKVFQKLGFAEAELLLEFGYPTQKLTLQKKDLEVNDYE